MEFTILIILLALLQFTYFTARVGLNRGKLGVSAPKTSGNETWERMYRVQQNTMEQLVIFIPSVLAFNMYVSDRWVLLPSVAFLVGRQLYSFEYIKDPNSRTPGMALSLLCNVILLLGALIGLVWKMI